MAKLVQILGVKKIQANMKLQTAAMGVRVAGGLKVAGLLLQRESQLLVPVDEGPLKASAFTRASGVGFATSVTVGYTALYALFVHELVKMKLKGKPRPKREKGGKTRGFYWDPQGRAQAKFLEAPARRLLPQMRAIVFKFAKLKGR